MLLFQTLLHERHGELRAVARREVQRREEVLCRADVVEVPVCEKNGLNPADPTDATKDRDKDGYSNIEEYLNSLVDVTTVAPVQPKKK